jgi:hypothetical protein
MKEGRFSEYDFFNSSVFVDFCDFKIIRKFEKLSETSKEQLKGQGSQCSIFPSQS